MTAMVKKTNDERGEVVINTLDHGVLTLCVVGTSPLIYNAMSEKTRHELLLPKGKKNAVEKAANLKHIPIEEYRNSVYMHIGENHPTRLFFPAGGFKRAMANAALDMPGLKKSQIGRWIWVEGNNVDIYGIPQLFMTPVRSADMNRTPDIRTRAILPTWACQLRINYVRPHLKEKPLINLLAAAGLLSGIGDWRQEKGSGSYGQFQVVGPDDKRFLAIVKAGGRVAQDRGLKDPAMYDHETEKLIAWYDAEVVKLGDMREKRVKRAA